MAREEGEQEEEVVRPGPRLEKLPPECLLQIFGKELAAITTDRERLNDRAALALVCKSFLHPARAALYGQAVVRAGGRASLLKKVIANDEDLSKYTTSISWTFQTKRASPRLLADLITIARPSSLTLGSGFFEANSDEMADLSKALYSLTDLASLEYGGFDLEVASSDHITHHLSTWRSLQSLQLRQVRFYSPYSADTLHDSFWQQYPKPTFRLKQVSISFIQPRPRYNSWGPSEISWLYWLLASSLDTLRSLSLANLGESLPGDAYFLLLSMAPRLRSLSITSYEGGELLADEMATSADSLVSLTLGGLASFSLPDGQTQPVLATKAILENRKALQYLEIQKLQLFERLDVLVAIQAGKLPCLRHIVLTQASRVHPQVQQLDRYCRSAGITLTVKR